MEGKRAVIAIVVIIMLLLILGGLLYQRTGVQEEQAQPAKEPVVEKRAAKPPEPAAREEEKEREAGAPETAAGAKAVEEEPVESVVEQKVARIPRGKPVAAPPISAGADCKPDPPALANKRKRAASEGMIYIPGGPFTMGSSSDAGHPDESPARRVCVSGFYIDKHEVTNAEFKKFVEATGYLTDAEKNSQSEETMTWRHPYGPDSSAEDMSDHPVVCVSWRDAVAYAGWAGKRLPTEAEWEKAARGTDGRIYPWGNNSPTETLANVSDRSAGLKWSNGSLNDEHTRTAPVGSFPKGSSVYGVQDMAGNVWEWCDDWWDENAYKTAPPQNPVGPQDGEFKVIRGGSWFYDADGARSANRMYFRPMGSSGTIGFRCVQDTGKER